jgi:hypothetical protein
MSNLLKDVYVNGPGTHFPGADHVMAIVILNQDHKSSDVSSNGDSFVALEQQILCTQRQAYFYQFKDNHIYNFEYEGTFIEELLDNGCILEMCRQGVMAPDEGVDQFHRGHHDSAHSSIDNIHHNQFDVLSTGRANPLD